MKGRVLVIDDNPLDLKIASHHMSQSGFEVCSYTDPQKALLEIHDFKIQLILLDLNMPQVDGFKMIQTFRALKQTEDTPLMIISGKNQTEDVKKAIQLGANDYIVKPIDPLVLQEKLTKLQSLNKDQFIGIDFGAAAPQASILRPLEIISVSEFGLKVRSKFTIENQSTFEIGELNPDFFGSDKVVVRCLSVQKHVDEYIAQLTFVGLTEARRQIIRQNCRGLWIKNKQEKVVA